MEERNRVKKSETGSGPGASCQKPGQMIPAHPVSYTHLTLPTNHRARFLAGRNRPATSFPLSDPVAFFHRRPWIILHKTSPDLIQYWLTVPGFGQRDPIRKQANVQESSGPASGPCFPAPTASSMHLTGLNSISGQRRTTNGAHR